MAKTGYRTFLKKERARVKLKGTKKLLPKGQNITDTNFKVKKIVIKDQIKEHLPGELLSKKKLNLKELLVRLGHHNITVKQDSLNGLKELITQHPEETLGFELAPIIEKISKLILDSTSDIRKTAGKLLSQILSQVELVQLTPLFPSLRLHLLCGLTHIEHAIREDSLFLLDALLLHMPTLCVDEVSNLLPICLDLVSDTTSAGRTLSLHLDAKIGAGRWRGKVLARILTLLSAVVKSYKGDKYDSNEIENEEHRRANVVKWKPMNYFPVYTPDYMDSIQSFTLSLNTIENLNINSDFDFKEFTNMLIPLLLDAFVELAPLKGYKLGIQESNDNTVPVQAAAFLLCSIDIIQCLWDILEQKDMEMESVTWLRKTFGNTIFSRLVTKRFPYSVKLDQSTRMKKSRENERAMFILKEDDIEPECYNINLKLSKLVVHICDTGHWKAVLPYLKNCLRVLHKLSDSDCEILASCFSTICSKSQGEEAKSIVSSVAKLSASSNSKNFDHFFKFMIQITLNNKLFSLHSGPEFNSWFTSLPKVLLSTNIPGEYLDSIAQISPRGYKAFSESFDGYIEAILDNIPNANVVGRDQEEVQMRIADLLYWVVDWDEELLGNIIKGIQNEYWGPTVTKHIKEIMVIIDQFGRSSILSDLLKENEWWKENVL